MRFHNSVLLKETTEALNVRPDGKYIDATFGGGGHSREIIKRGGRVLGIDRDPDAIEFVWENLKFDPSADGRNSKLKLVYGNFADIKQIAHLNNFDNPDGILFDLGLSSYQIEESGRGFSFLRDEPLDMRMSADSALGKSGSKSEITAGDIINKASEDELYQIFSKFGEEPASRAISCSIIRARRIKPIKTTLELAEITSKVVSKQKDRHPATRVFQALRIAVNSELDNLKKGLAAGFDILGKDGRMAVISFHSLEDRIVKLFFLSQAQTGRARLITKKPIVAGQDEVRNNRRSRSAKLRVIEKI